MLEFNENLLNSENDKAHGMQPKEVKLFERITLLLSQPSNFHNSKFEYNEMELLINKLMKWPN